MNQPRRRLLILFRMLRALFQAAFASRAISGDDEGNRLNKYLHHQRNISWLMFVGTIIPPRHEMAFLLSHFYLRASLLLPTDNHAFTNKDSLTLFWIQLSTEFSHDESSLCECKFINEIFLIRQWQLQKCCSALFIIGFSLQPEENKFPGRFSFSVGRASERASLVFAG